MFQTSHLFNHQLLFVSLCLIKFLLVVSLQLVRCSSDLDCAEGSYCHAPAKSPAHSRCQTCRRRSRRCHRDGMCCPGNQCSSSKTRPRKTGTGNLKDPSGKILFVIPGQVGDPCLRSSDCSGSLCCARHFWTRICKPVLMEGQVCTRQRRKGHQGLELFQRCSCGAGLSCRSLREPEDQPPSPSLLSAAAGSKFTASSSSSRHSSPRTFSGKQSSSSGPKTRLHVCQRI
uniref:Uncharacterized protein n=1 Tax=Kryptolebias marmoratus TaxID=37003 RepID=A0A3Q3A2T0_KRYMA